MIDYSLLTETQVKICESIKQGHVTIPEIAEHLNLNHNTVSSHLNSIRVRLRLKGKTIAHLLYDLIGGDNGSIQPKN